jgi:mannitol/fructose-specific phosphotransferase system IIA component (Ntr-type)
MNYQALLDEKCVCSGLDASTFEDAVRRLAEMAKRCGILSDAEPLVRQVMQREDIRPTTTGDGFAIPRGASRTVGREFIAGARLKTPVIHGGRLVTNVVLVGSPMPKFPSHLKAIVHVQHVLSRAESARSLSAATDDRTYFERLSKIIDN